MTLSQVKVQLWVIDIPGACTALLGSGVTR